MIRKIKAFRDEKRGLQKEFMDTDWGEGSNKPLIQEDNFKTNTRSDDGKRFNETTSLDLETGQKVIFY